MPQSPRLPAVPEPSCGADGSWCPSPELATCLRASVHASPRRVLVVAVSAASGLLLGLVTHPLGHQSLHRIGVRRISRLRPDVLQSFAMCEAGQSRATIAVV